MPLAVEKKKRAGAAEVARPRVVAVEDEEDFQDILRGWLTPHYDLVLLPHGEDLLDEIDLLQPDLVMMDLMLPGPDGLRLSERLRRHPRMCEVPILILTGRQDNDAFVGAMQVGASGYLLKPVGREELLERIKHLIES